jgi:hypothetical protein
MWNQIAEWWCRKMHAAMWPIHGRYVCSRCLREYVVEWEGPPAEESLAEIDSRIDSRAWLIE